MAESIMRDSRTADPDRPASYHVRSLSGGQPKITDATDGVAASPAEVEGVLEVLKGIRYREDINLTLEDDAVLFWKTAPHVTCRPTGTGQARIHCAGCAVDKFVYFPISLKRIWTEIEEFAARHLAC